MTYRGDITLEQTIRWTFSTVDADGVPTTLAGTPSLAAYEDLGTTQITAGLTLTVDLDGVTGLHGVAVAATAANGFEAAKDYSVVIAAGTVGGTSVVGYGVGDFSIENRLVSMRGTINDFDEFTTAFETTHGTGNYESDTTDLAAAIWDALRASHNTANTMGAAINTILGTTALDVSDIAVAVIDQARSGHTATGSVGEALEQIMNLPEAAAIVTAVLTAVLASYAASGNVANALTNAATSAELAALQDDVTLAMVKLGVFRLVRSGTTLTGYAEDEVTVAATWTLDDATNPTSIIRAS